MFPVPSNDFPIEYTVIIRFASGEEGKVRTKPETCRVSVRDFGAAGDGVYGYKR